MKYHNAAQPVWDPYTESAKFSTTVYHAGYDPNAPKPKIARCDECNGAILYPSRECGKCGKPYATEPCVDCGQALESAYSVPLIGPPRFRLCHHCARERRRKDGIG
jgi:hypothetical protein